MTDINVTPLIDVVLVMLIIFMVLTPLAEKQMYMRVPEFEPPDTQIVPPDAVPPDQIVLTALKNGRVLLNKTEMTVEDAMAKLKPVYEGHLSKVLFFNAQDGTRYEFAVDGPRRGPQGRREHDRNDDRPAACWWRPAKLPRRAPQ